MAVPPLTRASLLVRLRDRTDSAAWSEFARVYAGVVYSYARKRGLQDADAADLMQEVLRAVATGIGKQSYDRSKGSFRGWLYAIVRNKLVNFLESRQRQVQGTGDSASQHRLEGVPNADDISEWDEEYERRAFAWATERVRGEFQPSTWDAFWQTAVEGQSAAAVGGRLQMSPGAVYVAKCRVLARLKQEIQLLNEQE